MKRDKLGKAAAAAAANFRNQEPILSGVRNPIASLSGEKVIPVQDRRQSHHNPRMETKRLPETQEVEQVYTHDTSAMFNLYPKRFTSFRGHLAKRRSCAQWNDISSMFLIISFSRWDCKDGSNCSFLSLHHFIFT